MRSSVLLISASLSLFSNSFRSSACFISVISAAVTNTPKMFPKLSLAGLNFIENDLISVSEIGISIEENSTLPFKTR